MARLSKIIARAQIKANKGKDASNEIDAITSTIKDAVKAYKGTSKGAFEANKDQKAATVNGMMPMAVLDDASLLALIACQQKKAVVETCSTENDENYSLNAELSRAIATDGIILGACYHLGNESEGNALM